MFRTYACALLALALTASPVFAQWDPTSCNGGDGWDDDAGDAVDAECWDALETAVDTNASDIGTLETDLGTAESSITTLQGDVSTLDSGKLEAADATVHCVTKQLYAPDGSEEPLDLLGLPFAVTLTRYRCNTLPTTTDLSIDLTLQECTAGHASCANSDAAAITCDEDGTAWDTTITDADIGADDQVAVTIGTPTASMAEGSVTIDLCYSRQVVE